MLGIGLTSSTIGKRRHQRATYLTSRRWLPQRRERRSAHASLSGGRSRCQRGPTAAQRDGECASRAASKGKCARVGGRAREAAMARSASSIGHRPLSKRTAESRARWKPTASVASAIAPIAPAPAESVKAGLRKRGNRIADRAITDDRDQNGTLLTSRVQARCLADSAVTVHVSPAQGAPTHSS